MTDESDWWWGQPKDARRFHIFDGRGLSDSLCGGWMLSRRPGAEEFDRDDDVYRDGLDCKTCSRKAGIIDENDDE